MQDRIFRTLRRYITLAPGDRLGVAVSGGADSVALLRALMGTGLELVAVHVNHGFRGVESDGDERFVRELAAELGVGCAVYRGAGDGASPGLEERAREERLRFLRRLRGSGVCGRC